VGRRERAQGDPAGYDRGRHRLHGVRGDERPAYEGRVGPLVLTLQDSAYSDAGLYEPPQILDGVERVPLRLPVEKIGQSGQSSEAAGSHVSYKLRRVLLEEAIQAQGLRGARGRNARRRAWLVRPLRLRATGSIFVSTAVGSSVNRATRPLVG
jgi:hypothetical protein